jgi:Tol biopolymer transport system component
MGLDDKISRIAKSRFKRHIYLAAIGLVVIAVMTDAEAYEITQITFEPSYEGQPAWSPDGSKIAFVSDRDGNYEIYVMDANGGNPQRLTFDASYDANPSWSSDGKKIAFTSGIYENNSCRSILSDLYLIDSDGNNKNLLVSKDIIGGGRGCATISYSAWSPDGTKIVFSAGREDYWPEPCAYTWLFILNLPEDTIVLFTKKGPLVPCPAVNLDKFPSWSPDGDKIAYARSYSSTAYATVKGTEGYDVNDPGYIVLKGYLLDKVEWSPKGNSFIFSTIGSNRNIYIIPIERETGIPTGEPVLLTSGSSPSWSPDGNKIAFHYNGDIWVMSGLPVLNADIQHDGVVNLRDFATLANYWLQDGSSVNIAGGYVVDLLDLVKLAQEWLQTEPWYQP